MSLNESSSVKLTSTLLFLINLLFLSSCASDDFQPNKFYSKQEHYIPMRDGTRLFTSVYVPKEQSRPYPILLQRTPYRAAPYGPDTMKLKLGPSEQFAREGFIFVYQDVRGKFMSEGSFENVRPYIPNKTDSAIIDESSDTYDTIDWLVKNIQPNNGNVGMWGISYPGFYTSMGLIDAHPALKAASPQAPIADWFIGDDMHHNGAFSLLLTFNFFSTFGLPRPDLIQEWPDRFDHGTPDGYQFFLDMGPVANAQKKYFNGKIQFWNDAMAHGSYDQFWQERNILAHLKNIKPAILTVGGWFDAEDLYGTLNTYKVIESNNPSINNSLVMGPWYHGAWERSDGEQLGDIRFGSKTSKYFQDNILLPFFLNHLKGKNEPEPAEALCFDTGLNEWQKFDHWPPEESRPQKLFFSENQHLMLGEHQQNTTTGYAEYISDPAKPVPFINKITNSWNRDYMVADQRFAGRRPDVLVFESEVLKNILTLAGPIEAHLSVSTSSTDADFIVKLIDVYPDSFPDNEPNLCDVKMGGYQQLIRAEIMRAKFRNGFEKPEAMIPGKITAVNIPLQDVFHTFKSGHKLMVQIQSSWFPLFDRNPQKFIDIYSAQEGDFQKAVHRIHFSKTDISYLQINRLDKKKTSNKF